MVIKVKEVPIKVYNNIKKNKVILYTIIPRVQDFFFKTKGY